MTRLCILFVLLLSLCCSAEATRKPSKLCATLLCPNRESLIRQNQAINQMGIPRIKDEKELAEMVALGKLAALPETDAVRIAPSLPANRRYALPQTVAFLLTLADAYRMQFHQPLTVDSAVRPVTVQRRLHRHNANAAPVQGETASSHEAGCTIDLSRKMNKKQTRFMESRLTYYVAIGWVIVEEERHCFHIMTLKRHGNSGQRLLVAG